jgi:hypothetical protein
MTLGLLLSVLGVMASVTPAAAAGDTSGQVCNNQKDRVDQDCEGANAHGTIATAFDADGNLLFDIDATNGFGGWKQLYVCIPGTEKTNRADCQGNTASVLHPQPAGAGDYDVTTPATNTENDKDVTFACATSIDAKVFAAALPTSRSFTWTVHVNTCDGGTDEAFGTATRTLPQGEDFTYECLAAAGVTRTAATLRGATDDEDVDAAVFSFTLPAGETRTFTDDDATGGFSVDITGLTANTVYEYSVDFFAGDAVEPAGTGAGCRFTTNATPDTYACAAPSDVTATTATLRGSTSDGEVDAVTFELTPETGATTAVTGTEQGNSGTWSAAATGLSPATRYTYAARFLDGTDLAGTGGGEVCTFTTGAAVLGVVETRTAPEPEVAPAAVAPTAAAPVAVAGAELPRTGIETDLLLPLGIALVLLGVAAVTLSGGRESQLVVVAGRLRRPEGEHYR